MKLYIARHTQTNYNVENLSNADPSVDVHLTDLGKAQSESLSELLKSTNFETIYISNLRRTRQTADAINQLHLKPIIVDARLTDINMGFEGKPVNDFKAAFAASDNAWSAHFNDGESLYDVKVRVTEFLNDLRPKEYKEVLIVTSLVIIKMINGIINDISEQEIMNFDFPQGTFKIFELN